MADSTPETGAEVQAKQLWSGIIEAAKAVITSPAEFFRAMPRGGGFGDPLVFMVVMGVIAGLVQAVLGLVHLGVRVSIGMAIASVVVTPIGALIGGFIGAAILFVIWKLMGSQQSYETAYRCGAYMSAVMPITVVLGIIPWVGTLVGLAWACWLLIIASVEVHSIKAKTAQLVFGIIAALLALMSISAQITARRMARRMQTWQNEMGIKPGKDMTPEEAGRAAGAFLRGIQEEAQKEAARQKKEETDQ
jgi:hypothetical protein